METHKHNFKRICNTVKQPNGELNVYYECNVGYCQSLKKQVYIKKGKSTVKEMPGKQV